MFSADGQLLFFAATRRFIQYKQKERKKFGTYSD